MAKFLQISFLLLLISSVSFVQGQYSDEVWIIGGNKHISDPFKKYKIDFQFDARSSSFQNQAVRIGGLRLGIEHRRVHRFGLGVYGLSNNLVVDQFESIKQDHSEVIFEFNYATLYYERVLFFNPKWEISSSLHVGGGSVKVSYRDEISDEIEPFNTFEVGVAELSASGFYHFTYWLSVGGGFGYRRVNDANEDLAREYSSGLYVAKVKIRFGKLLRSIFNKDVKNEY